MLTKIINLLPNVAKNQQVDIRRKYEVWRKIQDAVTKLNTLQSNASTLEKIREQRDRMAYMNIPNMIQFCERIGLDLRDVDKLNIIHVSGTKGKGSTCAFAESILRQHGYKTGFFSSPHLVEVRERFRINGSPISREMFADYFWEVFSKLEETKGGHGDLMPAYFAFCTVMACHVFVKENVDVAILEVGIGGEYDSTNFITKPVVCGVSSLGLDHVSILGNTIEKIAWAKSGIFKKGVPAFTSPQLPSALEVLQSRAAEKGVNLQQVPPLIDYKHEGQILRLGIQGSMQTTNASLALQLCNTWLQHATSNSEASIHCVEMDPSNSIISRGDNQIVPVCKAFQLSDQMLTGMSECSWPGRNQTVRKNKLTYYIDGAHTVESVEQCVEWFEEASKSEKASLKGRVTKILVFNSTGDRDILSIISPLMSCDFDAVLFCPNIAYGDTKVADLQNKIVTEESQLKRCHSNMERWQQGVQQRRHRCGAKKPRMDDLAATKAQDKNSNCVPESNTELLLSQEKFADASKELDILHYKDESLSRNSANKLSNPLDHAGNEYHDHCVYEVFSCIYDALCWAVQGRDPQCCNHSTNLKDKLLPDHLADPTHIQILITGSLHLVGGVLKVITEDDDS